MRRIFWASTVVLGGVVLTGLSRNAGNKFVRTWPQRGCLSNYANVAGSGKQLPSELICCTGIFHDEGVCMAGRKSTTKVLASKWAVLVSLLALAVNAFCDWLAGGATAARTWARWNRFFLYTLVILGRTLVLYMGLGYAEGLVQAEESSNCWYAHLRRSGRCSERFDFADHVVLGVCQFFAVQVFELSCIIQEYRDFSRAAASASAASLLPRKLSPTSSSSSAASTSDSAASLLSRRPSPTPSSSSSPAYSAPASRSPQPPPPPPPTPSALLSVLPAGAVCVAVAGAALVLVYDTAAFFHSRAETIVALAISWGAVGGPLLGLVGARGVVGGGGGDGAGGQGAGARGGRRAGTTGGGLSPARGVFLAPYPSVD